MKHHQSTRKLGRKAGPRRALLRGLMVSLIRDEKIKTTEAKAKELRPAIERLVTKAKKDTLANRRVVISRTGSTRATGKLFKDIAPRYADRNGGYTRVIKAERRAGDASPMAVIEFV